jgi:hypothetical protein
MKVCFVGPQVSSAGTATSSRRLCRMRALVHDMIRIIVAGLLGELKRQ